MILREFCNVLWMHGRHAHYHISVIGGYDEPFTTLCDYEQLFKNGYMNLEIVQIHNPGLPYSFEHYYITLRKR